MICVSIARNRHRHLIAEHRHLVEEGVELVELRVDYINGPVGMKRLLRKRPGPVVITCRRERDGGRWKESESARLMLMRAAVAEGADYVDLEDDIAAEVPRFGSTKRIISYHNFTETPDDLDAIHQRIGELDPDIIKVCTQANNPHDAVRMLRLVKESKTPTVGICMGEMGVASRILTGRCGAPLTYASFSKERTLAPGSTYRSSYLPRLPRHLHRRRSPPSDRRKRLHCQI